MLICRIFECATNIYTKIMYICILILERNDNHMSPDKFYIKKQEFANRTLRFPVELLESLTQLASEKNTSLNNVVVQCCKFALKNLEEEPDIEQERE